MATAVERDSDDLTVQAGATAGDGPGDEIEVTSDELLVAAGREPNTDWLAVEEAGIEADDTGQIEANEYFVTTAENVWAFGDVIVEQPYWHAATHEAQFVVRNALDGEREPVDYTGMSHAIFRSPPVASLGRTAAQLADADREDVVGRAAYSDTALGLAMNADDGFVEVLADPDDGAVLGVSYPRT